MDNKKKQVIVIAGIATLVVAAGVVVTIAVKNNTK